MAAPIAVIAKKAVEIFASTKKGRQFIGYTIGIVIFLLLLPVIVIFALFGWMAGDSGSLLDQNAIIEGLPSSYQEQFSKTDAACRQITDTFTEQGLSAQQIRVAQAIYMSCLVGKEIDNETFYTDLADCFKNISEDVTVFDNLTDTFGVEFAETDIKYFNELYGGQL